MGQLEQAVLTQLLSQYVTTSGTLCFLVESEEDGGTKCIDERMGKNLMIHSEWLSQSCMASACSAS